MQPVSETNPQLGTGDTLVKIDGQIFSRNCKSVRRLVLFLLNDLQVLFSRPTMLVTNGTSSYISLMPEASDPSPAVQNAISAVCMHFSWDEL